MIGALLALPFSGFEELEARCHDLGGGARLIMTGSDGLEGGINSGVVDIVTCDVEGRPFPLILGGDFAARELARIGRLFNLDALEGESVAESLPDI